MHNTGGLRPRNPLAMRLYLITTLNGSGISGGLAPPRIDPISRRGDLFGPFWALTEFTMGKTHSQGTKKRKFLTFQQVHLYMSVAHSQ